MTYVALGGFGNRLEAIQIALLFALATRRTLVVQPFTSGHDKGRTVPYTAFLETITGLPTRLSTQMESNWSVGMRVLDIGPEHVNKDFMKVASRYESSSVRVIQYGSYYGYWHSMFRDEDHAVIQANLSRHIRLRRNIKDGAALIQTWLGTSYGCVHFRLGDRHGTALLACEELNCTNSSCCTTELGLTPKSVHSGGLSTDGLSKVYIATNRPNSLRAKNVFQSLRAMGAPALTWEGIPENIRTQALRLAMQSSGASLQEQEIPEDSSVSIIEQLVCIGAKRFLPSWPSSWDEFVINERFKIREVDAARQYNLMLVNLRQHKWTGNALISFDRRRLGVTHGGERRLGVTHGGEPATEAPATQAPATEAPATEAEEEEEEGGGGGGGGARGEGGRG